MAVKSTFSKNAALEAFRNIDVSSINPYEMDTDYGIEEVDGMSTIDLADILDVITFTVVGTINDDISTDDLTEMNIYIDAGASNAIANELQDIRALEADLERRLDSAEYYINLYSSQLKDYERKVSSEPAFSRGNRRDRNRVLAKNSILPEELRNILPTEDISRGDESVFNYFIQYALQACSNGVVNVSSFAIEATDNDPVFKQLTAMRQQELREELTRIATIRYNLEQQTIEKNKIAAELRPIKVKIQNLLTVKCNRYNQLFFNVDAEGKVSKYRKQYASKTWVFTNIPDANIHFLDRQNRIYNVLYNDDIKPDFINRLEESIKQKLIAKGEPIPKQIDTDGVFIIRDSVLARAGFRYDNKLNGSEVSAYTSEQFEAIKWKSINQANLSSLGKSVYADHNSKSNFKDLLETYGSKFKNKVVHNDLTVKTKANIIEHQTQPCLFTTDEANIIGNWCAGTLSEYSARIPGTTPYGRMSDNFIAQIRNLLAIDIHYGHTDDISLTYTELVSAYKQFECLSNTDGYIYRNPIKYAGAKDFRSIKGCIEDALERIEREYALTNNISLEDIVFIPINKISSKGSEGFYHFESDYLFVDVTDGRAKSELAIHPARIQLGYKINSGIELGKYIVTHNKSVAGSVMYSYIYNKLEQYQVRFDINVLPGLYENGKLIVSFNTLAEAGKVADVWRNEIEARFHGYTDEGLKDKELAAKMHKLNISMAVSDNSLAVSDNNLAMSDNNVTISQNKVTISRNEVAKSELGLKLLKEKFELDKSLKLFDVELDAIKLEAKLFMDAAESEHKAAMSDIEFKRKMIMDQKSFEHKMTMDQRAFEHKMMLDEAKHERDMEMLETKAEHDEEMYAMKHESAKLDKTLGIVDSALKVARILGSLF